VLFAPAILKNGNRSANVARYNFILLDSCS
jgi:hypothetical protein